MKQSNQRSIILKYLQSVKSHPTARQVYDEVKKQLPHISFATVYRNLDYLSSQGLIMELNYADKANRFDGNPKNHYHFSCQSCGRVEDLGPALSFKQIQTLLGPDIKGKVLGHRLEVYGLCESCQAKKEFVQNS